MDNLHALLAQPVVLQIGNLLFAYLLAFPVAWNREKEDNSAGLRTFPLVALASCGFVQASLASLDNDPEALSRLLQGLVMGVGFIGGGAILQKDDKVYGTATAASLWVTGAIGTAVGLGSYGVAIALSVITFASLRYLRPLKEAARKRTRQKSDP